MLAPLFLAAVLLTAPPSTLIATTPPSRVADRDLSWANVTKLKKGDALYFNLEWDIEEIVDSSNMIVACGSCRRQAPYSAKDGNEIRWNNHALRPKVRLWITGLPTDDIKDQAHQHVIFMATVAEPKDAVDAKGEHALMPHLIGCRPVAALPTPTPPPPLVPRNGPNKGH
jgi:hypothetical protein